MIVPKELRKTNHFWSGGDLKELCEAAVDGVVGVAHLHRAVHQADEGPGQEIIVNMKRNQLITGVHSIRNRIWLTQNHFHLSADNLLKLPDFLNNKKLKNKQKDEITTCPQHQATCVSPFQNQI